MQGTTLKPESATVLAGLVAALAPERDPVVLVRRTAEILRNDLAAEWCVAVASGESSLGGLRLTHGTTESDIRITALGFAAETPSERVQIQRGSAAAGFCLWLPQHTRLTVALGPLPVSTSLWMEVLDGAARFLLARLTDELELARALLANAALERRISDLSLLFKGLDVTLSSVELTKVLRAFLTCVTSGEAIGFNRAFLLLIDEEARELRGTVAVGPSSGEEASTIWGSIEKERTTLEEILRRSIQDPTTDPIPGSLADRIRDFAVPLDPDASILARAATATPGYDIHEYDGSTGPDPFAAAFGAQAFVVIPIQGRERTLGVIVADNLYTGRPISRDSVFLLSGLANHVGVVIENALMFEDVSRRYAELNEVQVVNRALLSRDDYSEVLRQIAEIVTGQLRATGTLLFVTEGSPPELRLEVQFGPPLAAAAVERCTEVARRALRQRTGVLERRVADDVAGGDDAGVQSLLAAPMWIEAEPIGVLVVYRSPETDPLHTVPFDRNTQRFLSIIADQATIAVLSGRRLETIREDQRQIQQLNELLYRNEKLATLGEVSSKIAHEIRNPLTALGGFARRVLKSPQLAPGDRESMEIIVRETARLERLLNDQLAFVRSARLQLAPTDINPLVREALALLRQQLELHHVTVEVELARDLPSARLDADRVKQVLVNVLMNAMEAAESGGRVRIATRAVSDGVEVQVSNTGPPIPAEVAATMFAPFTTTKQEGTGLGMAVVQQILVEHGGSVQVRTQPPWGSVFTIRLPLEPPEST